MDFRWEKNTASATLRLLSLLLIIEAFFLWIFSEGDLLLILIGFAVFILGDLGIILSKSKYWDHLFDLHLKKIKELKKDKGEDVEIVEAKIKPKRCKNGKK